MSFIKDLEFNNKIILNKCTVNSFPVKEDIKLEKLSENSNVKRIAFLDLETTGLDIKDNEIIEIAIKLVDFNTNTGELIHCIGNYESYNQPSTLISNEITELTGITNDMVEGKKINYDIVGEIISHAHIIVAHNAEFDRKVLEKYFKTYKIWACSRKDIDWYNRGFLKESLELLSFWHGFYYDAHRAVNDVNATINLISHKAYKNNQNKPIFELIDNAYKPHYLIINKFPYNESYVKIIKKRSRKYFFNYEDKSWRIILTNQTDIENEKQWLSENIYNGEFKGVVEIISVIDKYKN